MLQNPPRSTNNLSTSKSKPCIHFLGLLDKVPNWIDENNKKEREIYSLTVLKAPKLKIKLLDRIRSFQDLPREKTSHASLPLFLSLGS